MVMPPESLALWQGRPPGSPEPLPHTQLGFNDEGNGPQPFMLRGVSAPGFYVFRPARPSGDAVLILPGGSYNFLSIHAEGFAVARALSERGMTCFVLTYRLPLDGWARREDVPLQDAQRAMRMLRAFSAGFGFDPARLGVLGFSAGGHLAATLATCHGDPVYPAGDEADSLSARPAFAALLYPVIALTAHQPSLEALLGPSPAPGRLAARSPALRVGQDTSPCFLIHAMNDAGVPPDHSLEMIAALRRSRIRAELHLFQEGDHGFGLGEPGTPAGGWVDLFLAWLERL